MADVQECHYDSTSQATDSLHVEPIYESFLCPLTKQVMRDPVSIDSGVTFERDAILKYFNECLSSRRRLVCPVTKMELSNTELNPSIALRNTIDEWMNRNEVAKLDVARKSLTSDSTESDMVQALQYVDEICQRSRSSRQVVRRDGLIIMIADLLKKSSTKVRQMALETLRSIAKDDNDNKVLFLMLNLLAELNFVISFDASGLLMLPVLTLYYFDTLPAG
jgi:superfamily II RNA helicase